MFFIYNNMHRKPILKTTRLKIYEFVRHNIGELNLNNQITLSQLIKGYSITKNQDLINEITRLTKKLTEKNTMIRQYEIKINSLETELSKKNNKGLILE